MVELLLRLASPISSAMMTTAMIPTITQVDVLTEVEVVVVVVCEPVDVFVLPFAPLALLFVLPGAPWVVVVESVLDVLSAKTAAICMFLPHFRNGGKQTALLIPARLRHQTVSLQARGARERRR